MFIPPHEADHALSGVLPLATRMMRERCGLRAVEFEPRAGSPLHLAAGDGRPATVQLACDTVLAPQVLLRHAWQPEEAAFVAEVAAGAGAIALVDVGANQGLFTRQARIAAPSIGLGWAYEPDPDNFERLRHNLAPFGNAVLAIRAALAERPGELALYLDPDNAGNYSLTRAAMPAVHLETRVQALAAAGEAARWMAAGARLFYKSDTQGLDEVIVGALPAELWEQVAGGILELWRIAKPAPAPEAFVRMLDRFPDKAFLSRPRDRVSTAEVLAYLAGRDGRHDDLAFRA